MRKMKNRYVPHDILIQILLRLPVKSILRFKCVCKLWYVLFQNPDFISDHLNFHKTNSINNRSILVSRRNQLTHKHLLSIVSDSQTSYDLHLPQFIKDKDNGRPNLHIVGSLNGVLCIYFGHHICLWNPATRDFNMLPPPPHGLASVPAFGFGLKHNDLNVVRIMLFEDYDADGEYELCWVVELYSVMTGCWREVQADLSSDMIHFMGSNVYLNGSSHWCASLFDDTNVIFSFNFADELFRIIDLPAYLDDRHQPDRLVVVNGCIGLICGIERTQMPIDIWVIKKYGIKEYWTKMYTVEPEPLLGVYRLIGFLRNGEFLFQFQDGFLYCHDLETNEMENFEVYGVPSTMEFVCYVESLVSTKGGNEIEQSCDL